jgi:hypothetical protein
MKKILLLGFFAAISSLVNAQCFDKGISFANAGIGLGIQHYRFTDVTNNIVGPRDTSAAIEIPFSYEYGVLNFLGVSLNGNYAKYIGDSSSANENAKTFDVVPTLNIHSPLGWEKFDPSISFGYGYSHFRYEVNTATGGTATANGGVFNWGINLRLLFRTDGHFGMNFWYQHSSYNFKHGTVKDNYGNKYDFALDGPGNNLGIGLFYRIAD